MVKKRIKGYMVVIPYETKKGATYGLKRVRKYIGYGSIRKKKKR